MNQPVYKKIAFLAPRADLTREAFLLHWETIHGPVVASAPDYGRWRQRYVQNHIVGPGPLGEPPSFGGMAMFWLPGANEDDYGLSITYRDHVRPDELNFIDKDATVSMTEVEEIRTPGSGSVKLVVLVPRAHTVAGSGLAVPSAGVTGHRINHVVEGSMRLPGARTVSGPDIAQVHEIWMTSPGALAYDAFHRDATSLTGGAEGTMVSFYARERVFFDDGKPC